MTFTELHFTSAYIHMRRNHQKKVPCISVFHQRYILYRDLKLLLNIDICPRYDCRSGRQVNRGKKSIFLSAAESVLKVCILAKIYF